MATIRPEAPGKRVGNNLSPSQYRLVSVFVARYR